MPERTQNDQRAVLDALKTAAASDGFETLRSSIYGALERADKLLNDLIQYWKTGKRPVDPPDAEPLLGAIPFYCTHPNMIPVPVPEIIKIVLKGLVDLGFVPKTTISIADWKVLEQKVEQNEAVGADGTNYGLKKYEQLDILWILTVVNLILGGDNWLKFPCKPKCIDMPDNVTIGIVGDWGTGFYDAGNNRLPAKKVIDSLVDKNVDYVIHLGDVYYAGTATGGDWIPLGEEKDNFLDCWPSGLQEKKCFTLNSNHEMYGYAEGYFNNALKSEIFKHQCNNSYFLLQNDHWQIFGLDSAWWASALDLFMEGSLKGDGECGQKQVDWITACVTQDPGKKTVLMSHHNPLNVEGTEPLPLWDQAVGALGGKQPDYWYWGHVHNAIVYHDLLGKMTTKARCVGHGAIPFSFAWGLTKPESIAHVAPGAFPDSYENIDTVAYFAHEPVPGTHLVKNGFAVLQLKGKEITETFYDEDGVQRWPEIKPIG